MEALSIGRYCVYYPLNWITHAIPALISLWVVLFYIPAWEEKKRKLFFVYAWSIFGVFFSSALYHGLYGHYSSDTFNQAIKIFDHCCIFVHIAVTVAIVILSAFPNQKIYTVGAALICVFGVLYKIGCPHRYHPDSICLYYGLAGYAFLFSRSILKNLSWDAIAFIIIGGGWYMLGALWFYKYDSHRWYYHALWHICVNFGMFCHYWGLRWHVFPQLKVA
ncbi:MAG: hypothetical protein G01um101418_61 [Parcubacteria group bacterium Gr01-1014_18]|nr:MAG: hypothetical protein Greene041636_61 [Parcubacteria group bacterium Greene0416_36]TSC81567.1 MAG: hypothetical protein G01um101418_61 [Parcubacteria group bacterium Gr01-1014_18]TSC99622.1 MAG: hypothetical protein Greene101420_26 [Parcubacteria group bacterium Greene1014_20]TSD07073.1 MAG: hypothetical protein Greene07142_385 [Parcubacteria group bacterium Greene0714_2]